MGDQPSTATPSAAAAIRMQGHPAIAKRALRKDIRGKWGKFTEQELTDLRDTDDLASQLVAKYGLDKEAAQRDAAALVNGRAF